MSKKLENTTKTINTDCLIIGAGPAGLSCAQQLKKTNIDFLVVDMGKNINDRERYDKKDVVTGVGGAGFYSDGKFSFFPSATYLWKISRWNKLKKSYNWTKKILEKHGINAPNCPSKKDVKNLINSTKDKWVFKPYPSLLMEIDERIKFVESLYNGIKENSLLETKIESIEFDPEKEEFSAIATSAKNKSLKIVAKNIIAAGGRFFPHFISKLIPNESKQYLRTEIGFRLETKASHPFFADLTKNGDINDPKHVFFKSSDNIEWRTFCCCKQGEVVESLMGDFSSFSGRSDCPPTGRSNIAFNTRLLSPGLKDKCKIFNNSGNKDKTFKLSMFKVLEKPELLYEYFGKDITGYIKEGLERLIKRFPSLLNKKYDPLIVGPTIEGVGHYPSLDYKDLKIPNMPLYFAGDNCGKFRGIVAAMISGAYVGEIIKDKSSQALKTAKI